MKNNNYDVIIVGGGHAGCEASLIAAKLKQKVLLISLSLLKIGLTPCNPAIGGSAKGIVVREIDALGGIMGIMADKSALQTKELNSSRGPSVRSFRAQIDKIKYPLNIQEIIIKNKNITILEDMVIDLIIENKKIKGVKTRGNNIIFGKTVVLTTGTYMSSLIYQGTKINKEGPDKQETTSLITERLKKENITFIRLKTGTPPRVHKDSINYDLCQKQLGDKTGKIFFSFNNKTNNEKNIPCWLTYTNLKTHEIIRNNFNKSAIFINREKFIGPRYCPSIEDKISRFADKDRHQIFLEPESEFTDSIYLQGLSTSLPKNIQEKFIKSIKGLEKAAIIKWGYAIEYDVIEAVQLKSSLEFKSIENLFSAGQINGTSGYEEAAAQGLIAGINAAHKNLNKKPLILKRYNSHIGVLIDDLITKGTNEPYRLLTSRCEYRLLLRSDNADIRLTKIGKKIGTINDKRWNTYQKKYKNILLLKKHLKNIFYNQNSQINNELEKIKLKIKKKISAFNLIKNPNLNIYFIKNFLNFNLDKFSYWEIMQVEIQSKLEGYIILQKEEVKKIKNLENILIFKNIDYSKIKQMSAESVEKLNKIKPETLGQASRISGIKPVDIINISYFLKKNK